MDKRGAMGRGGRREMQRRLGLLAVVVGVMSAFAGVAVALAADRGQVNGFGSQGAAAGQFSSSGLRDVAVDQDSGRVYVVDAGAPPRINVFAADGAFQSRLGSIGAGKSQFSGDGSTWGPQGAAVDPDDGSVYVTQPRSFGGTTSAPPSPGVRVQKFDAGGAFDRMWGWGVRTGAEQFEVCSESDPSCRSGIPGAGGGQFGTTSMSARAAVSPIAPHHVFVADPANRRVQEFTADGAFVRAMGWGVDDGADAFQTCTAASGCQAGVATAGLENGHFAANQPVYLAIDASGILYASDSNASNRVQRLDTTSAVAADIPLTSIGGAGAPLLDGVTTALTIDRATDSLLVARDPVAGETVIQELGTPGAPTPDVDFTHGVGEAFSAVNGIDVYAATGDLYVSRSTAREVSVLNIGSPPTVTLGLSDIEGPRTATFEAAVDPNGARTRYRFEYRQVGSPTFTAIPSPDVTIPRGRDDAVAVAQQVTGLSPGANYEVRVAYDGYGPPGTTALEPFSTPPASPAVTPLVTSGSAIADRTAWLGARINPSNEQTRYRFEYTTDVDHAISGYDNATSIPAPDGILPAGTADVLVTEHLTDLSPNTTYHYRIVAENSTGVTTGPDQTFRTAAGIVVDAGARAYELVSPADKLSGVGVGGWYRGPGDTTDMGEAAARGERFAVQSSVGSVLLDGAFAYSGDWAFADRLDDRSGWVSHSPFTHPSTTTQVAKGVFMQSASSDLSRLAWVTNNEQIDIFSEMLAWPRGGQGINPTFLSDWGSVKPPGGSNTRWEVLGPTSEERGAQIAPLGQGNNDRLQCDAVFAADGSHVICSTDLNSGPTDSGASTMFGLAGSDDPTRRRPPDPLAPLGRSVYVADISGPLADNFADTGRRELVNTCTPGTEIPTVAVDGDIEGAPCPPPLPGDSIALVSDRGAAIRPADLSAVAPSGSTRNIVSENGSRVFFMSPDPLAPDVPDGIGSFCADAGDRCPPQLYVREQRGGSVVTRWISKAEDGLFGEQAASLLGAARFEGATPDGDKVVFRTNSPLTFDDRNGTTAGSVTSGGASNASWDLYLYDFPDDPAADPGDGELIRLSAGPTGFGDCNSPFGGEAGVGGLRFLSDDGHRAYFTCAAPLAGVGEASNGTVVAPGGTPATSDHVNLYVYDADRPTAGRWRFVTRVARSTQKGIDACASTALGTASPLRSDGQLTGQVGFGTAPQSCVHGSADGQFVTLWSRSRLTADDSDASTADIYAYDAEADSLVRVTAAQRGAPGVPYPCGTVGEAAVLECLGDGGFGTQPMLGVATEPLVDGDRVAFFQSRSRLVPEDSDDAYDVYQWRNGVLSLLSTGSSTTDGAFYKNNDATGRNVYMATRDRLSWQDFDSAFDIYTARACGAKACQGIVQPPPPAVCSVLSDGCQGPGAGSAPVPPASSQVRGGENAASGVWPRLWLAQVGIKARRVASRGGVLALRIRSNQAGRIRAVARARLGGRRRVVARRTVRLPKAGSAVIRLRLSKPARLRLVSGRQLVIRMSVRMAGGPSRSGRAVLRRAGR